MSHLDLEHVGPEKNPNEGREIWNENFNKVHDAILNLEVVSATGSTTVLSGSNTSVDLAILSGIPTYTVSVVDNPIFDSISATTISGSTLFSGNTELSEIFVSNPTPSVQQTVSASGDTTTIGTGIPTIASYDLGTIYITTFNAANTATGTTLNIDSVGVLNIEKYDYDLSGFTTLGIGEIQPSIQYFLTYDGARFQFSEIDPDSGGGTYTTPSAVPVTLGGVLAGTTYYNTPISDVFNDLFFPFLSASFSSFLINSQTTILEVGNSITAGSKTFSWNILNSAYTQNNSISIKDVTGGNVVIANGITNLINSTAITISSVTKSTPTLHRWEIKAQRTNGTYFTKNFDVNWRWKVYYGTSSATGLTSSQITGLTSSQLDTTIIGDTFSCAAGDYKYICVPSTFVEPTLIKDASTNLSIAMADTAEGYTAGTGTYKYLPVDVINQYFITQSYKVFRTRNTLGGSINIITT